MQLVIDNASSVLRTDDEAIEAIQMQQWMRVICVGATDNIGAFLIDRARETLEEAVLLVNCFEMCRLNRKDTNANAINRQERKLNILCREQEKKQK
uniref:Uncharacterized protein n=1 Tax=Plectus sambesii TaxID=2011161 RepID=A0A914V735_9BILA